MFYLRRFVSHFWLYTLGTQYRKNLLLCNLKFWISSIENLKTRKTCKRYKPNYRKSLIVNRTTSKREKLYSGADQLPFSFMPSLRWPIRILSTKFSLIQISSTRLFRLKIRKLKTNVAENCKKKSCSQQELNQNSWNWSKV